MSDYPFKITLNGVDATRRLIDRRKARVLNAANELANGPSGDIGFFPSVLCQTSLPCKAPLPGVRVWEKTNGHSSVLIEAGQAYDTETTKWRELPLPHGTKARLALIYLSTEAIRNKSPIIKIDCSMTGFLKKIIRRQPGANDIKQFKLQMSSLGMATIRLASKNRQTNSHVVSDFDLMWLQREGHRVLWPSELVLSSDYWESLKKTAVPIDLVAIAAISHSTLAIDIYFWLAQRLWRLDQPYTVYWTVLWVQFGDGYSRIRDFRRKFRQALLYATAVYPKAIIEDVITDKGMNAGIKLFKSPPPIPIRK